MLGGPKHQVSFLSHKHVQISSLTDKKQELFISYALYYKILREKTIM